MAEGQRRIRGRYTMLRRVDRGDRPGNTWLVQDEQTQELRALKQLSGPGRPDPDRISEELGLRRVADSPCLPELHDLFLLQIEGQQQWFLIRDWADGRSLEQVLAEDGALNPDYVRWLGAQLLERLAELHEHGLVHGDVHPHNVILTDEGESVTLVDHGSLKAAARQGLSGGWGLGVDPDTVAPETAMGRPSARSDLYSLGATLVQALTGSPIGELDRDDFVELLCKQHGASPDLAKVLLKLTEPLSDGRFDDLSETRRALVHGLDQKDAAPWWAKDFHLEPDPEARRKAMTTAVIWMALIAVPFWGVALLLLPPVGHFTETWGSLLRLGLSVGVLGLGMGLLSWSTPWLLKPLNRSFGATREGLYASDGTTKLRMDWRWLKAVTRRGPLLLVRGYWEAEGLGKGTESLPLAGAYDVSLEQLEHILTERMLPEEQRAVPPAPDRGPIHLNALPGVPLPLQAAILVSAVMVPCFLLLALAWTSGLLGDPTPARGPEVELIGHRGEIETQSTSPSVDGPKVVWARQCPEGMQPTAVVAHGQELMACDDLGGTMALVPGVEGESAPFLADRSEATVVQYTSCELAQGCTPTPNDAGCNAAAGSRDRHPVNCVSQAQARAYCAWQHKRLCTQDEFQRLGGGPQGYARPWGEMPATCELAVVAGPSPGCGKGGTWPVGARPRGASPVGCLDAVGNVSEWTEQGLMGGSWASPSGEVGLSSVGSGVGPTAGIRCCRDL